MKELVISGKANQRETFAELRGRLNGADVWACGTDARDGADLYIELHGIETGRQNTLREIPEAVYGLGLPINNTICAALCLAWLKGCEKVTVAGCPMDASDEYKEQKPALAWVCGWLNAKGMKVVWEDGPKNIDYGRNQ